MTYLSADRRFIKAAALICGAALAAFAGAAAAQTAGPEKAGNTKCSLGINGIGFPSLSAGKNAQGMTGSSSFSVNCSGFPGWITPRKGHLNDYTNIGMPFCVTLSASGADAQFTAAGKRVLYRNGQPGTGAGNALTFNFHTNYMDCFSGSTKGQSPNLSCQWGASEDASNYGVGYPSFMFNGNMAPNQVDSSTNLNYGAQIDPGQELFAGTYSNSFTAALYYNDYQYDSSAAGYYNPGNGGVVLPSELCVPMGQHFKGTRVAVKQIAVTAVVKSGCKTVTPPKALDFGRVVRLDEVKRQTGIITVGCTPGTSYQIGISRGGNASGDPASGGWRGAGCISPETCGSDVIYYNIYKDSGEHQIWGDIGSNNSFRGSAKTVTFYADIAPASAQPAASPKLGSYKDTVIVTLQSNNGMTQ